ncbi:kelch repeat-containing protein [Stenotrophomonas sp.]|uniref:Kelch repeat-containing protein n=1 Tax=Stenotrophomonas sp. TaxID=69392 RepID=UPI0028AB7103|nr:kelch repeat-containing protein [Stenotrophomonas sp.]
MTRRTYHLFRSPRLSCRAIAIGLVLSAAVGTASASNSETSVSGWQTLQTTGSAQGRHESSGVVIGDHLYVMGGRGDRALQALDLKMRTWRTLAAPPLEVHHAQAIAHAGKLLIITGFTGGFPDETPLPNVLVYDPGTNRWTQGAEIPEARRRGAAGVALNGDTAYVVGGNAKGHNNGYVRWADAFNIATGEWKVLADAPHARDHFHAVVVNGRVYAAAGRESSHNTGESFSRTVKPVDVYDIASNTWRTLPSPIPTPRAGTSAVAAAGKVLVLGGESGSQTEAHDEVEALDPASGAWTTLPSLKQGRHGFQAGRHGESVVVAAGSANRGGGPELNSVEALHVESD